MREIAKYGIIYEIMEEKYLIIASFYKDNSVFRIVGEKLGVNNKDNKNYIIADVHYDELNATTVRESDVNIDCWRNNKMEALNDFKIDMDIYYGGDLKHYNEIVDMEYRLMDNKTRFACNDNEVKQLMDDKTFVSNVLANYEKIQEYSYSSLDDLEDAIDKTLKEKKDKQSNVSKDVINNVQKYLDENALGELVKVVRMSDYEADSNTEEKKQKPLIDSTNNNKEPKR